MKFFKNIGNWVNDKLADTVVARLINYWQTQHPASYIALSAILVVVHDGATNALVQAQIACATSPALCIGTVEQTLTTVVYWASLILAVLTGTKGISSITNRPKPAQG